MNLDLHKIGSDLLRLATTEGPTQAAIQISQPRDPRTTGDFPIFSEVKKILEDLNLSWRQDLGNLVVFQGVENSTQDTLVKRMRQIPVTLGAHLDEITYIIAKIGKGNKHPLMPLCSPPQRTDLVNPQCRVIGFRHQKDGELSTIGSGAFNVEYREKTGNVPDLFRSFEAMEKDPNCPKHLREILGYLMNQTVKSSKDSAEFQYFLETDADVMVGDMVIQDYNYTNENEINPNSILHVKALDDRVGCIAVLYAMKELSELGIPSKAILTSSEEGVPQDVSWGRLVRPTYQKFCTNDSINIICDGIDGARLSEFKMMKYMDEAVVIPYTSLGKGGGDPGIFAVLRDIVIPVAKRNNILGVTSTDYVSRSYDSAIMHDFPLIGFIDWVNGKVAERISHCHLDESVSLQQIKNIIGLIVYAVAHFDYKIRNKPNPVFPS